MVCALLALPSLGSCAYIGSWFAPEPVPVMAASLTEVEELRKPLPPAARALPAPTPGVVVDHYPGTPLSGPRARAAPPEGEVWIGEPRADVRWTLLALQATPPQEASPLAAKAELLVQPRAKSPLSVRTRLAREAELWSAPAEDLSKWLAEPGVLLLARRNAVLLAEQSARLSLERAPGAERLELAVWSPESGAVKLTLVVQGLDVPDVDDSLSFEANDGVASLDDTAHREFLPLAEPLPPPGSATWIWLPEFFPESAQLPARDLLACVERLGELPATSDPRSVEAAERANRAAPVNTDQAGTSTQPAKRLADLSRENAVAALRRDDTRRSALIRLADNYSAPLCADLALVGSEELIAAIAERVEPIWSRTDVEIDSTWVLDRAAMNAAATRLQRSSLGDAAAAVLLRHAGEAGRFGSTLLDAARASSDSASLQGRLIDENRLFLSDRSPAARARALRFLRDLGQAPAGYDPLASRDARRAALEADRERLETQATDSPR